MSTVEKVRRLRLVVPVLALLLAVLLAGCGGGAGSSQGGGPPESSAYVPAGAPAYLYLNSDTGGSQWQTLDSLSKKFPNRSQLLAHLQSALQKQGIDWNTDVKPALGPEIGVGVLALGQGHAGGRAHTAAGRGEVRGADQEARRERPDLGRHARPEGRRLDGDLEQAVVDRRGEGRARRHLARGQLDLPVGDVRASRRRAREGLRRRRGAHAGAQADEPGGLALDANRRPDLDRRVPPGEGRRPGAVRDQQGPEPGLGRVVQAFAHRRHPGRRACLHLVLEPRGLDQQGRLEPRRADVPQPARVGARGNARPGRGALRRRGRDLRPRRHAAPGGHDRPERGQPGGRAGDGRQARQKRLPRERPRRRSSTASRPGGSRSRSSRSITRCWATSS